MGCMQSITPKFNLGSFPACLGPGVWKRASRCKGTGREQQCAARPLEVWHRSVPVVPEENIDRSTGDGLLLGNNTRAHVC
jgi:hypothetical protein